MSEVTSVESPSQVEGRVAVIEKKEQVAKSKPKRQPPYAVIVHNDNEHTWAYVTEILERVCGHDYQRAYLLTSQVHHTGRAIVWTGVLEVAELKRDQIRGFGPDFYARATVHFPLGVTIEPLPE